MATLIVCVFGILCNLYLIIRLQTRLVLLNLDIYLIYRVVINW